MTIPARSGSAPASKLIDQRIRELGGWRGETLARMRALILEAVPSVTEEWKWENPVWSAGGIICTGEAYRQVVKLTFARGASVPDPSGIFNASLAGNTRRAIDIREGERVNARAFKALVKAAAKVNGATTQKAKPSARASKAAAATRGKPPVRLLSSGNPQIAKADGDAPVQAYIAAMPGWKSAVGKRLNAIIEREVPKVVKAVKWNTPLFGVEGKGFFLGFYCYTRYISVTFFEGASLQPPPPEPSKHKAVRYLKIFEGDLDQAQFTRWVKQAATLPGWTP
jgi:hypothetical protein